MHDELTGLEGLLEWSSKVLPRFFGGAAWRRRRLKRLRPRLRPPPPTPQQKTPPVLRQRLILLFIGSIVFHNACACGENAPSVTAGSARGAALELGALLTGERPSAVPSGSALAIQSPLPNNLIGPIERPTRVIDQSTVGNRETHSRPLPPPRIPASTARFTQACGAAARGLRRAQSL